MSRVLVSLVSEQTIPNYLFIKEMERKYDRLLFITTETMTKRDKGKSLERALNLHEYSIEQIVVSDDSLNEILEKLESDIVPNDNEFIVNLTCGTKIMSISVYDFFSKCNSTFYYIPIGKNTIRNLRTTDEIPLKYRLNVAEHLTLSGLYFEADNSLIYPSEHTSHFFERFKKTNFNRLHISEIVNAQSLSNSKDRKYYSGAWFEEYVYLRVKKKLNLDDDKISKGVKIYRKKDDLNDNELDLIFTRDNQLYIIECKVSMIGYGIEPKKLLEQYMYKLAAISKDFGLTVNSYIFTLHKFDRFSQDKLDNIEKRKKILSIRKILDNKAFKENTLNL